MRVWTLSKLVAGVHPYPTHPHCTALSPTTHTPPLFFPATHQYTDMSMRAQTQDRRDFVKGTLGTSSHPPTHTDVSPAHPLTSLTRPTHLPLTGFASALGFVALASSSPANAGYLNADKLPEVIKPKDAEIDQGIE